MRRTLAASFLAFVLVVVGARLVLAQCGLFITCDRHIYLPVVRREPSPTPPPTPTPKPRPLAEVCRDVIENGGFEGDGKPWRFEGGGTRVRNPEVFGRSFGAFNGEWVGRLSNTSEGDNLVAGPPFLPPAADRFRRATVRFALWAFASRTLDEEAWLLLVFRDASGAGPFEFGVGNNTVQNREKWQTITLDVPAHFIARHDPPADPPDRTMEFTAVGTQFADVRWFIDAVSLEVCAME